MLACSRACDASIVCSRLVNMFEERFDISMELEARESSFAVKIKRGAQVQNVELDTVGDIVDAVRQIVDAKVG